MVLHMQTKVERKRDNRRRKRGNNKRRRKWVNKRRTKWWMRRRVEARWVRSRKSRD